ncbi:MAG: hypothetical protein ACI9QC_000526 [Oceanicoccus sp.]|jgi:hypothetical protein
MKKLLTLILLSALAAGCQGATEENEQLIELQNLNLTAQESWDVIYFTRYEAQVKVPDPVNQDFLTMEIRANNSADVSDLEAVGVNGSTMVYDNACGGAFDCFYLQFEDTIYDVNFTTSSSELPPENLDGIWNPTVEVETYEMIDLLLTAE